MNLQVCQNCPGVNGFTVVVMTSYSTVSPMESPATLTCFCRASLYIGACSATGACVFPSDILLVAAMNPCPCGFLGDPRRSCSCDPRDRRRYSRKLSGPLLDRIDLHVTMAAVPWEDLGAHGDAEASDSVRARVSAARARAAVRAPGVGGGFRNADISAQHLVQHCSLDAAGRRILQSAVSRLHLSVRALHRALRVARTIADLAESERVAAEHLAEALSFRITGRAVRDSCPNDQVDSGVGPP